MKKQKNKLQICLLAIIAILAASTVVLGLLYLREKQTAVSSGMTKESKAEETVSDILRYSLDEEMEEELTGDLSNTERCEILQKNANQWKEFMEYYLSKVEQWAEAEKSDPAMAEYAKQIAEDVLHSQTQWEESAAAAMQDAEKLTSDIYYNGTIASILLCEYEYQQNRSRAIELFQICRLLRIDIDEAYVLCRP